MKVSGAALLLAGLLGTGCAMGTSGGPGASDAGSRKPLVGQADETFRLTRGEAVLRQGETKSVTIAIKRALNFEEDVTLALSDLPKGLSVDNLAPVIKHGDTEARFVLTASEDASVGDFSLKVTGHPTRGSDATNELNITVSKK